MFFDKVVELRSYDEDGLPKDKFYIGDKIKLTQKINNKELIIEGEFIGILKDKVYIKNVLNYEIIIDVDTVISTDVIDDFTLKCDGHCGECSLKICSVDTNVFYTPLKNCIDCNENNCKTCFKKDGFINRGGARAC